MTNKDFVLYSIIIPLMITVVVIIGVSILFPPACAVWASGICIERNY